MFDTFATLLSSIPTFLFPVFASYKALKSTDPALLKPWLMYWVVLACALLFESWTGFILVWVPFYAWIRLAFLLYLILPQTQGAKVLYQTHVHPFLQDNETAIDDFISSAHDRAKQAGVEYLKQAIELIKIHIFGLPPKEPTPPSTPSTFSYTQSLIARFNLPSARPTFPGTGAATSSAADFYSLLASAVTAATSGQATTSKATDLSNSGTLIPPSLQASSERLSFISAQRERLSILLSALDKEASNLQTQSSLQPDTKASTPRRVESRFFDGNTESEAEEEGSRERPKSSMSGLSKSKSENDFEKIDADSEIEGVENGKGQRQALKRGVSSAGGSWLPWSWGAKAEEAHGSDTTMTGTEKDVSVDEGKSSGVEL